MSGLEKTFGLLLLIIIGLLLKRKLPNSDQINGVKNLILSVALPATIFIALLGIEIESNLLLLPVLALLGNLLMFGGTFIIGRILGLRPKSPQQRSLLMLVPSWAPGLSCFPFLIEYLGEEYLAMAAIADVGNKVFVLILLYLLAMQWYYLQQTMNVSESVSTKDKVKDLVLTLFQEPINFILFVAIAMLSFGLNFSSLPDFIQSTLLRLDALMIPLVLIFIGLVVKLKEGNILFVLQSLFLRSAMAFGLSAIMLLLLPASFSGLTLLLLVIFPQSACSFWPFAHMSSINGLSRTDDPIFDIDLGLNLLAFSLPFSCVLVLSICVIGTDFAQPLIVGSTALVMLVIGLLPFAIRAVNRWSNQPQRRLLRGE